MSLLDVFKKSKKVSTPCYLGRMWACAVKCKPWSDLGQRYGVVVKDIGIVEAFVRGGETRVLSDERDPFREGDPVCLAGPVGRLEYVSQLDQWIGFFETEDEAKEGYRQFADALVAEIKSASTGLGLTSKNQPVMRQRDLSQASSWSS